MKAYRLTAWPDLGAAFERTPYRRMLSDMSQRHVSVAELCERSGLPRHEVLAFVDRLSAAGQLLSCEAPRARLPISLRPLRRWLFLDGPRNARRT